MLRALRTTSFLKHWQMETLWLLGSQMAAKMESRELGFLEECLIPLVMLFQWTATQPNFN